VDAKLGTSSDLEQSLRGFLASHPARTIERQGRPWRYVVAGRKAPAQLVLPGAVGNAESTFLSILELESDFRLLAPTYPTVATMNELVEGIAAILTTEGMEELGVLGGSYGAAVAQCFVRRYPERVSTLILSHGGVPRPDRARRIRRFLRVLPWIPPSALRFLAGAGVAKLLPGSHPELGFWKSFFKDSFAALSKDDLVARYQAVADFDENYRFTREDLQSWSGRVLILDSDDDPLVPAWERKALRELYPQARLHTFQGTGHAAAIVKREEYFSAIRRFLLENAP